jgi:hypothetical protein
MPAPGSVQIQTVNQAVEYDPSEAIDQVFLVGQTQKGSSVTPYRSFSLAQWVAQFGAAVAGSNMYQAVRTLFEEGAKAIVTIREVGPAPVRASRVVKNVGGKTVLTLEAQWFGNYANTITTQFTVLGAGVKLTIREGATILAESGELLTQEAIVAYCASTGILTASLAAEAGLPAADGAAVALAGGTDDGANATNTQAAAAANLLDKRQGPGMIAFPGKTTEAAHNLLVEHHLAFDRVGLADLVDSGTAATLVGNISATRALAGCNGVLAAAPWVITPDAFTVPASAFVGAKIAQQFLATGNPNEPAAGENGKAQFITGLTQDFSSATREALDAGAVNAIHNVNQLGDIRLYGFDTLASPTTDSLDTAASNALLDMLIRWKARKIGRSLAFKEIDPQGHLTSRYHGRLDAMLKEMEVQGAVYAFEVDTDSVNNIETAREKKLYARIGIQRSQYSKVVYLEVMISAVGAPINV